MIGVTVLTTTYNRDKYLINCYRSLENQTCKDFEWVIIDDGSNDETEKVAREIITKSKDFVVSYYKKSNGGKHRAINYAQQFINGTYVIILDDDDELTNNAIELVLYYWRKYKNNPKVWCLSFEKSYKSGRIVQTWPGKDEIVSNHITFRVNKEVNGDCAEVVRSDLFKELKFPEFEGEKFLGEACVWVNAARKYDTVYIKRNIYMCEYLEGGLSQSGRKMRLMNPNGGMYTSSVYMNSDIKAKVRTKNMILYDCYAISSGKIFKNIMARKERGVLILLLPISYVLYIVWSR